MEICDYLKQIGLPNKKIESRGEISSLFLQHQIHTLWDAISTIRQLPYERTTDRSNFLQVLKERRGTCSGKHALIAKLGQELGVPLKLYIGIFLLTPQNRPKIASLLEKYRLEAIPEAHTYLKYQDNVLDITFPESTEFTFEVKLEEELEITPEQVGPFKVQKHQEFIREWAGEDSFKTIWEAREEWIQSLT